jgi:hypothetical protein
MISNFTPSSKPSLSPNNGASNTYTESLLDSSFIPGLYDHYYPQTLIYDGGNGKYTASVCPFIAGVFELHVLLNGDGMSDQPFSLENRSQTVDNMMGEGTFRGQYIDQSPYSLFVTSGLPNGNRCEAYGSGIYSAVVGTFNSFIVTIKDTWGNVVIPLTDFRNQTRLPNITITLSNSTINFVVENLQNGSVVIQYIPQKIGFDFLEVLIDGLSVIGSPFSINILSGMTSSNFSQVLGSNHRISIAGDIFSFTIEAYDLDGNVESSESDIFSYLAVGYRNFTGTLKSCGDQLVNTSNSSFCDGTGSSYYYGYFVPKNIGIIYLHVYLKRNDTIYEIRNSPVFIQIIASFPMANFTLPQGIFYMYVYLIIRIFSVDDTAGDLEYARAGRTAYVTLHLNDLYNNPTTLQNNFLQLAVYDISSIVSQSFGANWSTISERYLNLIRLSPGIDIIILGYIS